MESYGYLYTRVHAVYTLLMARCHQSSAGRGSQLPWHLQQELLSCGGTAIGTAKELGIVARLLAWGPMILPVKP